MKIKIWNRVGLIAAILLGSLHIACAFYDPGVQRWVNKDPLGDLGSLTAQSVISFSTTDAMSGDGIGQDDFVNSLVGLNANLNIFNANNPINEADPDGRCPWCIGAIGGAAGSIALQFITGHGSVLDRLRAINVCDVGINAVEGAVGLGALKNISAAYKAYKLAKDVDAVAEGAKDSVLIAKGTAESIANSIKRDVTKAATKAAAGIVGGEAAKKAVNAADTSSHGNGKRWCTPFK